MGTTLRRGWAIWAALAASGALFAHAAPQILLPAGADLKSMAKQPERVKSVAQPVRFNAAGLFALKPGDEVELTLPNATRLPYVVDLVRDHGDGMMSWIAYYRDGDMNRKYRAIVTVGPDGTVGQVATPQGDYRIVPDGGQEWLVDLTAETALQPKAAPRGVDYATASVVQKGAIEESLAQPDMHEAIPGVNVPFSTKVLVTPPLATVDVMFVYTPRLAAHLPGTQLATFFNNLIATANTAYADSRVGIQLRMAGSMSVDYPDATDLGVALDAVTNNTGVFSGVEARRTALGADMVSLYLDGADFGGGGIGWVPSHPIGPADAWQMYSAVSGCVSACPDVWIHELGHNMGNQHDRATGAWEASTGQSTAAPVGSYSYSYGFYTCNGRYDAAVLSCNAFGGGCTSNAPECSSGVNAYSDIMAYFNNSTQRVLRFSNPDLDCPGSSPLVPCGLAEGVVDSGHAASADAARSMNNNAAALSALRSAPFTLPPMIAGVPKKVDFNLDGKADLVWKGPNGAYGIWLMNGASPSSGNTIQVPANSELRAVGDFNGDGKTDLLWRGNDGSYSVSLMNGLTVVSNTVIMSAGSGWDVIGVGDFNGDLKADLLWSHPTQGYAVWLMNGAAPTNGALLSPPGATYAPLLLADFDGDHRTDILWRAGDGSVAVVLMNGTAAAASGTSVIMPANSGWRPTQVADLNNDGKADIVWSFTDGSVGVWLMNGLAPVGGGTILGGGTGWTVAFTPDLDGNGTSDLVFRRPDGTYTAWLMNGISHTQVTSANLYPTPNTPWSIAAIGDLDGNGTWDLMWRNSSDGTYGSWLMNGVAPFAAGSGFFGPNSGWNLAP